MGNCLAWESCRRAGWSVVLRVVKGSLMGFLLSVWGQNLEFMAMGTSCICKAFLRDYECDPSSFHKDKYDVCNLTSLQTALSCQHDSLFSFLCEHSSALTQSSVPPVLTWAFPQGIDCTCCSLSPGWFFSDSSDLFLVIFAHCTAVDISETKEMNTRIWTGNRLLPQMCFLKGSQTGSHYPEPRACQLWAVFPSLHCAFHPEQTNLHVYWVHKCLFIYDLHRYMSLD